MTDEVEFGSRPWHGSDNPFEAMWLHFTAEIAKLRGGAATVENAGTVEALPMHEDIPMPGSVVEVGDEIPQVGTTDA